MGEELENPATATATAHEFPDDNDGSCCSTPFVSAPSSPGRDTNSTSIPIPGFYFSAPTSPVHFVLSKTINSINSYPSSSPAANASFDFDFSASLPPTAAPSPESMTSADELFLNGQIRPMKLSTHLRRPQLLPPLIEPDEDVVEEDPLASGRGRDFRAGSLRRRTRSMSPTRYNATTPFDWVTTNESEGNDIINNNNSSHVDAKDKKIETTPSRTSSKRWVMLKEFLLYRSKSEGRNTEEAPNKFWASLSFSPVVKDKKVITKAMKEESKSKNKNRDGKKRVISAHELHYNEKRAQAEEMRKRTFLPYRQGLLGACLGFTSKSYGAMNGFASALNSVSSRSDEMINNLH